MPIVTENEDLLDLSDSVRDASALTPQLFADVTRLVCRRFPSAGQAGKAARVELLIASQAWTDAVLALIDLELPQWQVRRLTYDEGEWHCALSRERELPEWLDQSVEAHHADLPMAILCACIDARLATASPDRTSVPAVPYKTGASYEPLCCDNFF